MWMTKPLSPSNEEFSFHSYKGMDYFLECNDMPNINKGNLWKSMKAYLHVVFPPALLAMPSQTKRAVVTPRDCSQPVTNTCHTVSAQTSIVRPVCTL